MFEIVGSDGFIEPGTQISYTLASLDKELIGKPISYETAGGGWKAKQTNHYNESGKVSMLERQNETTGKRSGAYVYYYAQNGLIHHVNESPSRDEYFYQENGWIVKSEVVNHGDIVSYSLYEYDNAGNIGIKTDFY